MRDWLKGLVTKTPKWGCAFAGHAVGLLLAWGFLGFYPWFLLLSQVIVGFVAFWLLGQLLEAAAR